MIDYKRVLLALARNALRRRQMTKDEGDIVGWATNESGEHYPIHAPTGGGVPKSVVLTHPRKHTLYGRTLENGNVKWGQSKDHPGQMWGTERGGMKAFLERAKKMGYTLQNE